MADILYQYDSTNGSIIAGWVRTTSDSITVDVLEVDGVDVAHGVPDGTGAVKYVVLVNPTEELTTGWPNALYMVDWDTVPSDAVDRAAGGGLGPKDPMTEL